jgi:hypothetical protein
MSFVIFPGITKDQHSDTFRSDTMKKFHFKITNSEVKNDPLLIHVQPNEPLTLYINFDSYPTATKYKVMLQLPCLNNSLPWPFSKVDNYTILIMDFNQFGENVYLGLRGTELTQGLDTPNNVGSAVVSEVLQVNYTIDVRNVGCKFWSEKSQDKWSSEGCRVSSWRVIVIVHSRTQTLLIIPKS